MEVSRRNCEGKWTPGIIRVDLHVESFVRALANLKRRAEFRFPSFVLIADLMRPSIPPTLFPPPFDAPCHVQFLPYLRVEQECWPFHGKALDISSIIRFPPIVEILPTTKIRVSCIDRREKKRVMKLEFVMILERNSILRVQISDRPIRFLGIREKCFCFLSSSSPSFFFLLPGRK